MAGKRLKLGSSSVAVDVNHSRPKVVTIPAESVVEVVCRATLRTRRCVEPSSEHERQIVSLIDKRGDQTRLPLCAVVDIAASLKFIPSKEETQFLVRYFIWWRDRQILS